MIRLLFASAGLTVLCAAVFFAVLHIASFKGVTH